jgi:hypothetical protein
MLMGRGDKITAWPGGEIADNRCFEVDLWFHKWTLSNLRLGVKIVPHVEWPNAGPEPRLKAGAQRTL